MLHKVGNELILINDYNYNSIFDHILHSQETRAKRITRTLSKAKQQDKINTHHTTHHTRGAFLPEGYKDKTT